MEKILIKGLGITNFGELWNRDLRSLAFEAGLKAIKDAELDVKDIDCLIVANMAAGNFSGQEHLGALVAQSFGLKCPAFHIEGACASGGLGIFNAFHLLNSGSFKNILVIGAEKMTDISVSQTAKALAGAADEEWESFYGATFPSLYALMAREHFRKYGTTETDLALIAVKNHHNGSLNPLAQFRKEITVDEVLKSSAVATPLKLLDCSPVSDGAAAVVLSNNGKSKYSVEILTSQSASSSLSLHDREEITTIDATVEAAGKAYKMANMTSDQIDIAEVHDCFTIAELVAYEDLGFAKKGEGAKLVRDGETSREGRIPVNTSGGLKACGHPVGATGLKQIVEVVLQLAGRAGERQLNRERLVYGLTHNVGGSGATSVVSILKKYA